MYLKKITTSLIAAVMFSSNVLAASSVDVIDWTDDRSNVSKYNISTDINGNKGIVDKNGTVVMDYVYKDIKILPGWNKFAVQKSKGRWTIINISGENFLKSNYDYINTDYCENGYVITGNYGANEFNNKEGAYNKNMELVIPVEYQSILYTDDGRLLAGKLNSENTYDYYVLTDEGTLEYVSTLPGIISKSSITGTYYIKNYKSCLKYDSETEKYTKGYITVTGLADSDLNVLIEPIYENDTFSFYNNLAIVKKGSTSYEEKVSGKQGNGKYGIVDRNGNEIIECKYDSIIRKVKNYILTLDNEKTTLTYDELLNM